MDLGQKVALAEKPLHSCSCQPEHQTSGVSDKLHAHVHALAHARQMLHTLLSVRSTAAPNSSSSAPDVHHSHTVTDSVAVSDIACTGCEQLLHADADPQHAEHPPALAPRKLARFSLATTT